MGRKHDYHVYKLVALTPGVEVNCGASDSTPSVGHLPRRYWLSYGSSLAYLMVARKDGADARSYRTNAHGNEFGLMREYTGSDFDSARGKLEYFGEELRHQTYLEFDGYA
jgi:hypothetical protein